MIFEALMFEVGTVCVNRPLCAAPGADVLVRFNSIIYLTNISFFLLLLFFLFHAGLLLASWQVDGLLISSIIRNKKRWRPHRP